MAAMHSGVPSPLWLEQDVSAVAFRCHVNGATERATGAFLDGLAKQGVRRLRAYVDEMTDTEICLHLGRTETVLETIGSQRRGDMFRVRQPSRWPWRDSSGQAHPLA
jgi:hypothetical protein